MEIFLFSKSRIHRSKSDNHLNFSRSDNDIPELKRIIHETRIMRKNPIIGKMHLKEMKSVTLRGIFQSFRARTA